MLSCCCTRRIVLHLFMQTAWVTSRQAQSRCSLCRLLWPSRTSSSTMPALSPSPQALACCRMMSYPAPAHKRRQRSQLSHHRPVALLWCVVQPCGVFIAPFYALLPMHAESTSLMPTGIWLAALLAMPLCNAGRTMHGARRCTKGATWLCMLLGCTHPDETMMACCYVGGHGWQCHLHLNISYTRHR